MTKIVHVGLPKCASTSLQYLFVRASGTSFIGKAAKQTPRELVIARIKEVLFRTPNLRSSLYITKPLRDVFREMLPSDRPISESDLVECRHRVDEAVGMLKGDPRHVLVSDEVLSGAGFVYFNEPRRPLTGIVDEVGRMFGPEAMVLVVMRSQLSFLQSYWKHLVRTGYPFTFHSFLGHQAGDPEDRADPQSVTSSLFFDRIRRHAEASAVRIAFVPFEDVIGERRLLTEILGREGIRIPGNLPHERKSNTDESHIAKLERNRKDLRKRGRMFAVEDLALDEDEYQRVLSTRKLYGETPHRERLTEVFRPENRAFAEATGVDLKAYKYPV